MQLFRQRQTAAVLLSRSATWWTPFLLEHTVSHFEWRNDDQFDDGNLEYKVGQRMAIGTSLIYALETSIGSHGPCGLRCGLLRQSSRRWLSAAVVWPIIKWRRGKVDITTPRQG